MKRLPRSVLRRPHRWFGLVFALAALPASCADEVPGSPRLGLSADGAYVLDGRSQLAWPRCVEGMPWNGKTCVGSPLLLSHDQAMARARDRGKERGVHLRLPQVSELQGLVRRSASSSGLDPALFPAAPAGWHWSATAAMSTAGVNPYNYGNVMQGRSEHSSTELRFLHAWAVNLSSGEARADTSKRTKLPVRLLITLD